MTIRIPTYEEYYRYTGLHCKNIWAEVSEGWICPSCSRTKFQILRWTMRFPNSPNKFMDWVATLHRHHDHSRDYGGNKTARFTQTILCGQCNTSEGAAKRKLQLPKDFSFSPNEIRQFISATPHGAHSIDFNIAFSIYNDITLSLS